MNGQRKSLFDYGPEIVFLAIFCFGGMLGLFGLYLSFPDILKPDFVTSANNLTVYFYGLRALSCTLPFFIFIFDFWLYHKLRK